MTWHLRKERRMLTLDAYIHRATVGLPKAERLDMAAELRTHLLERISEHQAQGFSQEEAEYLAVKAMGDPQPVNRKLLGHIFTYRAGWMVLAGLFLGWAGWWGYGYIDREWLPPKVGIHLEEATLKDMATLFTVKEAPRKTYQAAQLVFPKETKTVVHIKVASPRSKYDINMWVGVKNIAKATRQNMKGKIPRSYRHQERWLWTNQKVKCQGKDYMGIYLYGQTLKSKFWNRSVKSTSGLAHTANFCDDALLLSPNNTREVAGKTAKSVYWPDEIGIANESIELKINQWTVLSRFVIDPTKRFNTFRSRDIGKHSKEAVGMYLAVIPLNYEIKSWEHSRGSDIIHFIKDQKTLPKIPEIALSKPDI